MNSDREWDWYTSSEVRGPRHKIDLSEKTQPDDPAWLLAYGAPETLPVSQEIEHGPALNRYQRFLIGTKDAVDSPEAWDRANDLFSPRRARRFRPASNGYTGDEP